MTASNQTQQTPPVAELPEDMRAAIDRFSDAAYQCGAFRGGSYATWRAEAGVEYDAALAAVTTLLASHQRLVEALRDCETPLLIALTDAARKGDKRFRAVCEAQLAAISAALASMPKEIA